jgi:hypothetical protein
MEIVVLGLALQFLFWRCAAMWLRIIAAHVHSNYLTRSLYLDRETYTQPNTI